MSIADIWRRGPMDKASAYGAGDCRFESCRGHFSRSNQRFTLSWRWVSPVYGVRRVSGGGTRGWAQKRRGGGIESLHVSMPRDLKSRLSTSPTHPGR